MGNLTPKAEVRTGFSAPQPPDASANVLSKAIRIEQMMRFKAEGNRHVPTVRQVLKVDDAVPPIMSCRLQDPDFASFRVDLDEPLQTVSSQAAWRCVEEQLDEDLRAHVGRCRCLLNGKALEVTVADLSHADMIEAALQGVGVVARKGPRPALTPAHRAQNSPDASPKSQHSLGGWDSGSSNTSAKIAPRLSIVAPRRSSVASMMALKKKPRRHSQSQLSNSPSRKVMRVRKGPRRVFLILTFHRSAMLCVSGMPA